jgi:hypothetical protein
MSKRMKLETEQLCRILEGLLDGSVSPGVGKTEIDKLSFTGIESVYGNLFHYLSDADIRERDQGYKELQDLELKKLIGHLRTADFDKAKGITFLTRTEDG